MSETSKPMSLAELRSNLSDPISLREGLRLLEHRKAEDTAKLVALRDAAEVGWSDLTSGHYDDIADENLDNLIAQLGLLAARSNPSD